MNVSIDFENELFERARAAANARGQTLSEFVSDALQRALARADSPARLPDLPTFKGDGVLPGVDLTSWSALLDIMEDGLHWTKRR